MEFYAVENYHILCLGVQLIKSIFIINRTNYVKHISKKKCTKIKQAYFQPEVFLFQK